jgi:hypothetical protein
LGLLRAARAGPRPCACALSAESRAELREQSPAYSRSVSGAVIRQGLDSSVTIPMGWRGDAARCFPLVARAGAHARPGGAPLRAIAPAVWLARRGIPRLAGRPGVLSSSKRDDGSYPQEKAFGPRRQAEQRNLLAGASLDGSAKKLYELLNADDPVHRDDIVERSGLNSSGVLATLFTLEMQGIVRQLPGKQFCKVLL